MLGDIRFSLRLLARDRSFATTAILTISVCLAANTAIFGIVRSVLLAPLPVPDAHELVLIYNSYPHAGAARAATAVPDYFDRLQEVPALSEQALLRRESSTLNRTGDAIRITGIRATPSLFTLTRMQPVAGRVFSEEEGEPGQDDRVLLAHGFWQREFGGDRSVVGRTIRLDGRPRTVVGVAPADFVFLWNDIDVFVPAAFTPEDRAYDRRHSNNWQMVGRLRPGAGLALAQAQVDALNAENDERFPEFRQILKDAGFHSVVVNLQDDLVRDVRAVLYLLWGGVLFVLVIGCVNIANLAIVRATARARELATRHAVGASLARLARQLLTETVVVSVAGGAIGIALGGWALRQVAALNLDQLPRGHEVGFDAAAVTVMAGLTLLLGLALGLAPAARLRRLNMNAELREEGRGGTAGRHMRRVRRALATAQVAVAFVLLVGAGLLFSSFRAVLKLDLGFDPDRVQTAALSLPSAAYPDAAGRTAFVGRLLEAAGAIPGVETAAVTSALPFSGASSDSVVLAEGYQMKPGESLISPTLTIVSPGYFESMGIELAGGRYFAGTDAAGTTPTVIIDERLARKWWPDGSAVGRRLYFPTDMRNITAVTGETTFMNVVGVVREVRMSDPRAALSPVGAYYLPYSATSGRTTGTVSVVLRTRTQSDAVVEPLRRAVAGLDPGLALYATRSMDEWIDRALAGRRLPVHLALAFGGVGLFLAAIGVYGVLAYGVAERRRELGVRMALGGSTGQVFALVLGDGLRIVGAGLVAGAAGAWLVGRAMASELYAVSPLEPGVIASVAAVLAIVALVATLVPSWRAARIDPISVIRT